MGEQYRIPELGGTRKENKDVEQKEREPKRNDAFYAIRHGPAEYQLNEEGIIDSDNPEAAPDSNKQWFRKDLTPEGRELAKEEAKKFFDTMDPEKDALFFVSSDLVRAPETAMIYMEEARERGFEIITPGKYVEERSENQNERDHAEFIGEGNMRRVNALTLDHLSNMLREFVFHQDDYKEKVKDYEKVVSKETKEKWEQARAIIEADNRGRWGPNYMEHSEKIEKIFPDVKSASTVHREKFLRLMKLVLWGDKKIREQNPEKNIKVIGFTHENSFLHFLNREYGESLGNCEAIRFRVEQPEKEGSEPKIMVQAKGQEEREVKDRYEVKPKKKAKGQKKVTEDRKEVKPKQK